MAMNAYIIYKNTHMTLDLLTNLSLSLSLSLSPTFNSTIIIKVCLFVKTSSITLSFELVRKKKEFARFFFLLSPILFIN